MTHNEAMIELMKLGIHAYNDTVYRVPSQTEKRDHIVTAIDGVAQSCTCKWFQYGGWKQHKCLHALAVEAFITEVKVASQPVETSAPVAIVVEQAVEVVKTSDEKQTARRGYLTRSPEVRRDPERGIILR